MTEVVDKLLKIRNRKDTLLKEQIQKLREFDQYIITRRQIRPITREHQMSKMMIIAEDLEKPFESVTKEELVQYLTCLNKKYSPATLEQMKCLIKKFYHWMGREDLISWIKLQLSPYQKEIDPKQLWSYSDVKELIKALPHIQHQALVFVLFESECRISEALSMNICDVMEQGDRVSIWLRESKTKKRMVGLLHSVIYLKKWLEKHPYRNLPDHPLWISFSDRSKGNRLKPSSINEMLHNAQKRSGVDKKITPHLLRHSMCSNLRKQGYPDAPHRIRMGLKPGSKIIENYSHISEDDANNEYLKSQGVKVKEIEVQKNQFDTIKCWKCGKVNTPTSKYCSNCNSNITVESAEKDFLITEVFRSKFTELFHVDVEHMIKQYNYFKFDTYNMEKILDCFNGGHGVTNDVVKNALQLDDDDCLELLQYLMTNDLITLKEDKIILKDKKEYRQFLNAKKIYLEVK